MRKKLPCMGEAGREDRPGGPGGAAVGDEIAAAGREAFTGLLTQALEIGPGPGYVGLEVENAWISKRSPAAGRAGEG